MHVWLTVAQLVRVPTACTPFTGRVRVQQLARAFDWCVSACCTFTDQHNHRVVMMMSNDHSFNARISKVDCSHALRVTVDMPIIWSYSSERCDKAVCVFIGAGCLGVFLACLNLSTCPLGAYQVLDSLGARRAAFIPECVQVRTFMRASARAVRAVRALQCRRMES